MFRPRWFVPLSLALAMLNCGAEDPRIPEQMYQEAVRLNQYGNGPAARALLQTLISRYPETLTARQARKDLFIIESMLKQGQAEQQKTLRIALQRVADALTRYRNKNGQYPANLLDLVPDYLEQIPEAPWGHPFLYRPFVPTPMEDVRDRRGNVSQRFNTKLEEYILACLGTDLAPGGTGLAEDILVVDGEFSREKLPPPIATPQPVR